MINEQVRDREVRVISSNGEQLGIMSSKEAMKLAREAELPIIVHSREAAKDTLDVMKASKAEEIGGIVHCFSYEKEMAREYIDMGFYLGIGGVITFKNARKLREVVEYAPISVGGFAGRPHR